MRELEKEADQEKQEDQISAGCLELIKNDYARSSAGMLVTDEGRCPRSKRAPAWLRSPVGKSHKCFLQKRKIFPQRGGPKESKL